MRWFLLRVKISYGDMMLQLIELFAGIGSQTKALKNLNIKHNVINICEWDIDAIISYASIHHDIKDDESLDMEEVYSFLEKYTFSNDGKVPIKDIRRLKKEKARLLYIACKASNNLVSVVDVKGEDIKIDNKQNSILTYSFPCQDLSNQGKQKGLYNGGASSMLWQVQRILTEMKDINKLPKNLLMENVPAIRGPKHSIGFELWQEYLEELGYKNHVFNLRTSHFGLPQNRDRTFMFSSLDHNNPALEFEGGGGKKC